MMAIPNIAGRYRGVRTETSDIERDRGITILARTFSVQHRATKINVIDMPGNAGELAS